MNIRQFEENVVKKIRADKIKVKNKDPYLVTGEYTFNMDWKLKADLDILCSDLKQNDDGLIIIVAPEGSGKTVLETQIGYYISQKMKTSWNCDNVHFEGQSYIDSSLNSPQYIVNALDESRRALNKMRGMTGNNVDFNNFLSECRDQNQIHIIVLPAYSDLEQYVAIHRVKYIIQVIKNRDKKSKKLLRGTYRIIDAKSKYKLKEAWKNGYKDFPKSMIIKDKCKFENVLCLNEKDYKKKKTEAKKERYATKTEDKEQNTTIDREKQIVLEHHREGKSARQIAKMLKRSNKTISIWINEFKV